MKDILTLVYNKVKDSDYQLLCYTARKIYPDHKIYPDDLLSIDITDDYLIFESIREFIEISLDNILSVRFDYDGSINIHTMEGALYELRKKID